MFVRKDIAELFCSKKAVSKGWLSLWASLLL